MSVEAEALQFELLDLVLEDAAESAELTDHAIIALSPVLTGGQKAVYNSWGVGKYDARYNFDGQNGPAVIPPAYGLAGVNSITYTGDGDRPAYWNRYVAVTQDARPWLVPFELSGSTRRTFTMAVRLHSETSWTATTPPRACNSRPSRRLTSSSI